MSKPKFLYAFDPGAFDCPEDEVIIVILRATWVKEGHWDDTDPFESLASSFGLGQVSECYYAPDNGDTAAALDRLAKDKRFARDQGILP